MIDRLAIAGYRSIRSAVLRLGSLNLVTGANGSGKTSLYRALRLLSDAATDRFASSLAREGGLSSVLWAGPEVISPEMLKGQVPIQGAVRKNPVSLRLGFTASPYSYCFDLGLPVPDDNSMFATDPEMKRECLWRGTSLEARNLCVDRNRSTLRCRPIKGTWKDIDRPLTPQKSMLTEFADPFTAPELVVLRETLASWRFYDSFRTDTEAPARRTSLCTMTPVMSHDGSDLAAAVQTIFEIGDAEGFSQSIEDAFPGSEVLVTRDGSGLRLSLEQPGMLRELSASELSDGTLRYLLLATALFSPRPPELLVLNEPEASLHPDLIRALGRLILSAAERSQIIVVSHDSRLTEMLQSDPICVRIRLQKRLGETIVEGADLISQRGWKWPSR
ncbi:MAG: AAA family ATPase [Planctomycetota bacterium]